MHGSPPEATEAVPWSIVGFAWALTVPMYASLGARMFEPDTGWHLAAGRHIREHGVPRVDPWSWSAGDTRWLNLSWGWDLGVAAVHDAIGPAALAGLMVCVYALVPVGVLAFCLRRGAGVIGSLTAWAVVTLAVSEVLAVRPQQVTLLGVLAFTVLLHLSARRPLWLLALPPLMLAWVNTHGGYPLGLVLVGLATAGAAVEGRWRQLPALLACGAVSAATVLLTPFGREVFGGPGRSLSSRSNDLIQEWHPVVMGVDGVQTLWFLLFVVVWRWRAAGTTWAERLAAPVLLVMGLSAARHFSPVMVALAPALALATRAALEESGFREAWARKEAEWSADLSSRTAGRVASGVAALVIVALFLPVTRGALLHGAVQGFEGVAAPWQAMEAASLARPTRLYNDVNLGGAIVYRYGATLPLFVDGRMETAYPAEIVWTEMGLWERPDTYPAVFDDLRIDVVVLGTTHPVLPLIRDDARWTALAEEPLGSTFARAR